MATVKFHVSYDDSYQLVGDFGHPVFDKKHSNAHEIVYVDSSSKDKLILDGTHLGHDSDGVVSQGTIRAAHFETSSGKHLLDITHMKISGSAAHDAFVSGDAFGLLNLIFGGNDKITGSSGGDYIVGWDGNDRIDGGKGNDIIVGGNGKDVINAKHGNDIIYFDHGSGDDKVLHFNAHGDDLIWTQSTDYQILGAHHNHDTIIKFDSQDELLLVGVRHNQITDADFYNPDVASSGFHL